MGRLNKIISLIINENNSAHIEMGIEFDGIPDNIHIFSANDEYDVDVYYDKNTDTILGLSLTLHKTNEMFLYCVAEFARPFSSYFNFVTVTWVTYDEIIEKIDKAVNNFETIELDEPTFLALAKMANQRDVTITKMLDMVLREFIEKCEETGL